MQVSDRSKFARDSRGSPRFRLACESECDSDRDRGRGGGGGVRYGDATTVAKLFKNGRQNRTGAMHLLGDQASASRAHRHTPRRLRHSRRR